MSYAIKTAKGYLATQGTTHWFQDHPVGWALYLDAAYAHGVAEAHHSAIGTRPEEGYTLQEIENLRTPADLLHSIEAKQKRAAELREQLARSLALESLIPNVFKGGNPVRSHWQGTSDLTTHTFHVTTGEGEKLVLTLSEVWKCEPARTLIPEKLLPLTKKGPR